MTATAPTLNLSVHLSWMFSHVSPQNPLGHRQWKSELIPWFMQVPPFMQGLSKHTFLLEHIFLSGTSTHPSPQLQNRKPYERIQICGIQDMMKICEFF